MNSSHRYRTNWSRRHDISQLSTAEIVRRDVARVAQGRQLRLVGRCESFGTFEHMPATRPLPGYARY
jgi:hypothetical protein